MYRAVGHVLASGEDAISNGFRAKSFRKMSADAIPIRRIFKLALLRHEDPAHMVSADILGRTKACADFLK